MAVVVSGEGGAVLAKFFGRDPGDQFGARVGCIGDVDEDSIPDFVVMAAGAYLRDRGQGVRPRGYLTCVSGSEGEVLWTRDSEEDSFQGWCIESPGDVNGDGRGDVLLSYVPSSGLHVPWKVMALSGVDGSEIHTTRGDHGYEAFGFALAVIEDLNSDGVSDFAASSPNPSGGYVTLRCGATGKELGRLEAPDGLEEFGHSLSGAADLTGDGSADLAIGFVETERLIYDLSVYSLTALEESLRIGPENCTDSGFSCLVLPDVDGDGLQDLVCGRSAGGEMWVVSLAGGRVSTIATVLGPVEGRFGMELATGTLAGGRVRLMIGVPWYRTAGSERMGGGVLAFDFPGGSRAFTLEGDGW